MASTSNAYDFDLFDSRDHGSAAPKLPEPKAPQKQKQKNNVVKLDEKQLRRSHRHSANTVKMLMNLAVVLVIVGAIGAVVFSQVQLTELTDEINTANESLSQEKALPFSSKCSGPPSSIRRRSSRSRAKSSAWKKWRTGRPPTSASRRMMRAP